MPDTAIAPTSTTTSTRGFPGLCCFHCGNTDSITINLMDVTEFHCQECDADMTITDVQEHLAQWQRVLAWVELAPVA